MSGIKRPFYQPFLYRFSRFVCWIFFKIIWRLHISGEEHIPKQGAVIIAANHRSLADPPLVGVSMKRMVHFIAKEELFRFRPFGWLISNLNAHPLRRGGGDVRAFKTARKILGAGEVLILFPEGRRSKTEELQPAKPGVGMLAALSECPVVPTYIKNSGFLKQLKPVSILFGSPLYFRDHPDYQSMAEAVMREISVLKSRLAKEKI
ncbi:MAG: 1-acyl-sn-glycerol-3-phosphate acyltransferase [Elusimicrobia bacterium]|nr:1-acyl-sn-glycerol-3-phosphate acyltransferase [Elusimicrobiota bacterium]